MKLTATTEQRERTEPTDRSIPPVIMTKVTPRHTMPRADACRRMFSTLPAVRKAGSTIDATMMMSTSPIRTPRLLRSLASRVLKYRNPCSWAGIVDSFNSCA